MTAETRIMLRQAEKLYNNLVSHGYAGTDTDINMNAVLRKLKEDSFRK